MPSSRTTATTCAANASLNSMRSMSFIVMPARFERLRHRLDRPDAHHVGLDAGRGEGDEARERLEPELLRALGGASAARRAAPSEYGLALPAVTVPFTLNAGLSFASPSTVVSARGSSSRANVDVVAPSSRALPRHALHRHGHDLVVERARSPRARRLLLAAERPRVLIGAAHLPALGDALGGEAHADVRLERLRDRAACGSPTSAPGSSSRRRRRARRPPCRS